MKYYVSFLLAVILLTSAKSQTSIPDPEYSARPYFLTSTNELKPLERADATIDAKAKGMGYGGVEYYFTVFSKTSPVRFTKATIPHMVIKIDGNADPSETIVLAKVFEQKKDCRRFIRGKSKLGGKHEDTSKFNVPLEFKKLRDGVFEIILGPLEPGEYAFMPISSDENPFAMVSQNQKITCFGIDE